MVPLYQSLLLIDPFVWLFVLLLCVVFCLCGFFGVTLSLCHYHNHNNNNNDHDSLVAVYQV